MERKTEETAPKKISISEFAKGGGLQIICGADKDITLVTANINRPGLPLAGYSDYFASARVQVIGKSELEYIKTLPADTMRERLELLFSQKPPCIIVSRGQDIPAQITELAGRYSIPVFRSDKLTAVLVNDLYVYLNELLAPTDSVHGILLDVYGIGVLITGRSGIGKSETALELIHRGHRLVSDDIVDLKEINSFIYGSSPDITRYMMEIRGLGIIDIKALYGVGAIRNTKKIQLNIHLEIWDDTKEYNRAENVKETIKLLGAEIPRCTLPVVPGRNLAVLIEVAARDFRLKQGGYSPIDELNRRMG